MKEHIERLMEEVAEVEERLAEERLRGRHEWEEREREGLLRGGEGMGEEGQMREMREEDMERD